MKENKKEDAIVEIIKNEREKVQKLFKENSKKQKTQEIILKQAEQNMEQLKNEEQTIYKYANALSTIECYWDLED